MSLVKNGQIANCCAPNALLTLAEYLNDYASPQTLKIGVNLIENQVKEIPHEKVKSLTMEYLARIHKGERDFNF